MARTKLQVIDESICQIVGEPPVFALYLDPAIVEVHERCAPSECRESYELSWDAEIVRALPAEIKDELLEYFAGKWGEDGVSKPESDREMLGLGCLWYDREMSSCRHYDHRPAICRQAAEAAERDEDLAA